MRTLTNQKRNNLFILYQLEKMNKDLKFFIKDARKWQQDYIKIWIKTREQAKQWIYDYIKEHKDEREKDNVYGNIDLSKCILFINQL